jgi:UDP-N-acetylmuramyl pentapeptide phosphotransferase/UDP-N-acetylglucosamine-1-phosphate transferase
VTKIPAMTKRVPVVWMITAVVVSLVLGPILAWYAWAPSANEMCTPPRLTGTLASLPRAGIYGVVLALATVALLWAFAVVSRFHVINLVIAILIVGCGLYAIEYGGSTFQCEMGGS